MKRKKQTDLASDRFRYWLEYSNPNDPYDHRPHKLASWWSNAVCDDPEGCACFDIEPISYQVFDGKLSSADKYIINRYGDAEMLKQSVNMDMPTKI